MTLGRLLIIATKVIPVIMALSYMLDDILMFYGIDSVYINYLSGISLLPLLYFYLTSYALKAYRVDDFGEEPAYTVGHIVEKMYGVFKGISV